MSKNNNNNTQFTSDLFFFLKGTSDLIEVIIFVIYKLNAKYEQSILLSEMVTFLKYHQRNGKIIYGRISYVRVIERTVLNAK
jgi:hypothetical protein